MVQHVACSCVLKSQLCLFTLITAPHQGQCPAGLQSLLGDGDGGGKQGWTLLPEEAHPSSPHTLS